MWNRIHFKESYPSTSVQFDDVTLRDELRRFGVNPVPIVDSARRSLKTEIKFDNMDELSSMIQTLKVNDKQFNNGTFPPLSTTMPTATVDLTKEDFDSRQPNKYNFYPPSTTVPTATVDLTREIFNFGKPNTGSFSPINTTTLTVDLTKVESNAGSVLNSTRNSYIKDPQNFKEGLICYDMDKLSHPTQMNVKQPNKNAFSSSSDATLRAELRSFRFNMDKVAKFKKVHKLNRPLDASKVNVMQSKKRVLSTRFTIKPMADIDMRSLYRKAVEARALELKRDNIDRLSPPKASIGNVAQPIKRDFPSPIYTTPTVDLKKIGLNPGPTVNSMGSLLLRNLEKLNKEVLKMNVKQPKEPGTVHTKMYLLNAYWMRNLTLFIKLEADARQDFAVPGKKWPGGNSKKSYTYLLLDPRVKKNPPVKTTKPDIHLQWTTFIASIFYVGKGKSERPYKHLTEAKSLWEKKLTTEIQNKKIQNILNIWKANMGVVCLQVFHNVIPAEALTNEAAMIDAIGLKSLTNVKSGSYKGIVESWTEQKRSMFGVYLLYKAMRTNLNEGERQLRPEDV